MKSPGYGDFHSHLVPGVDDGARTLDESLAAIGRMVDVGVRRIVTTPHLRASRIADGEMMEWMDGQWGAVKSAVAERWPELDFRRGFEIKLDVPTPDLTDRRLRLGGTSFVLVEWPMFQVPPRTPEVLARLREAGCLPVVAHPERYQGIDPELEVVRAWKEAGAWLQGNYGSLVGQYGGAVAELAWRMLAEGLLDYLSSDFHGRAGYRLYLEPGVSEVREIGGEEQAALLAEANPDRLFRGLPPLPVPPLEAARAMAHVARPMTLGARPVAHVARPMARRMRRWFRG